MLKNDWNISVPQITTRPPRSRAGIQHGPLSQMQIVAACVNGDDTTLSDLIPHADAELPGLFAGAGSVMGFAEDSIHASALRVLQAGYPDAEYRDEPALASSAFAMGFVVAARLFGGVR